MTGTIKARFYHAADQTARLLVRPLWRYVWNYIDQRVAPRDKQIKLLNENLSLTLRAYGAQIAKLSGSGPFIADAKPLGRPPRVSIIIPTDTRIEATENLLHCLQYLDGPEFEVIVIRGPTDNGMAEMLAKWEGSIKLAHNPERNISISRNLGARLSSGDIIALIDDDALPEPDWLTIMIAAFENPEVGAVGGAEIDNVDNVYMHPYLSLNRLGRMEFTDDKSGQFNFPLSYTFPFARGLNSAFRREAFFGAGGFDEEYEYYFDESDLCCRIVDAGWHIKQLPDSIVHHKALPSHLRDGRRVVRDWYPTLKAKLYFSLVNNKGHYPVSDAIADWHDYVRTHRVDMQEKNDLGKISGFDAARYEADATRAFNAGLERGLSGQRRLINPACGAEVEFLPFPRKLPAEGRRPMIFACQDMKFLPILQEQARAVAETGHHVYLIIPNAGRDQVDFERTLWVYRAVNLEKTIIEITGKNAVELIYLLSASSVGDHGLVNGLVWTLGLTKTVAKTLASDLHDDEFIKDNDHPWVKLTLAPTKAAATVPAQYPGIQAPP